jgi:hypothetical protein
MGDYHGVTETAAKFKTDAVVLGTGLGFSFSSLSIAEWAAVATIIYTVLLTIKLLWNWARHGK